MSRPLIDHKLPGLGPRRLAILMGAGVFTLDALASAAPKDVGALRGFSKRGAAAIVASARAAMAMAMALEGEGEGEGARPASCRGVRRPRPLPTGKLGLGAGRASKGRARKRPPLALERVLALVLDPNTPKRHMKRTRLNAKRVRKTRYGMD